MRKILAALSALVVLVSPVFAAEWKDGHTPANGVASGSQPIGAWDGASHRALRSDASGILRTTEEYPITTATSVYPAATLVPLNNAAMTQLGNGWSAYPYGFRSVYIKRTCASGTSAPPAYLYLYSSDDNINFYPVFGQNAFSSPTAAADTSKADTLMVTLPQATATYEGVFPLPESYGYLGKYLALFARREGAIVQTFTVIWFGRQK